MNQRLALVTGGSGGIGAAICHRLAADGLTVIVGYHRAAEKAETLVAELGGSPHRAETVDVDDAESLTRLAASVGAEGGLDVLVNCAGITQPVPHDDLDGLDDDLFDRIMRTNVRGPFAVIRALRSALERAESPVVVNISSVAAVTGQGSNVAYCASKAALDSLTRSLGRALAPQVRVVSVSPGWVLGEYAARMPAEVIQTQADLTPMARLASPADVAAGVSAVVHDLPFTTGSVVPVDGGRPLGVA